MGTFRKYKLDESFFEIWNSDSAYIAGWIAGDGSILGRRLVLCGSLAEESHLESMLVKMGSTHPVRNGGRGALLAEVGSKKLVSDLQRLGLLKSGGMVSVPGKLGVYEPSFIRGLLDSDGSIGTMKKNGRDYIRVTVGGICRGLIEYVYCWGSARIKMGKLLCYPAHGNRRPLFQFCLYGKSARAFLDLIRARPGELFNQLKWARELPG